LGGLEQSSRDSRHAPSDFSARQLPAALQAGDHEGVEVLEVILATNPNTEGEATANYISRPC